MDGWADPRDVVAPDDDRKEEEFCNGRKHEASEKIDREVLGREDLIFR